MHNVTESSLNTMYKHVAHTTVLQTVDERVFEERYGEQWEKTEVLLERFYFKDPVWETESNLPQAVMSSH